MRANDTDLLELSSGFITLGGVKSAYARQRYGWIAFET